ncbi:hypothetical protein [Chryseobacterium arthrosphaerae]|uniref:hypothetical protein n=1 Tax=Chryseobacterium arthrosphaerae TaxID=651561 RepID=UPI001E54BEF2|nr:hypothetical protein [Chryseobacterium arthrosphaerae]UEQ77984.1 thrombospondin type 3 repeat-containing protein [Chryseobacterium arthrosphaerae]
MKKLITLLLQFPFCLIFSQQTQGCKCIQFEKLKDSLSSSHLPFRPVTEQEALTSPFQYISVKYIKQNAHSENIINPVKQRTKDLPYDNFDAIYAIRQEEFDKKVNDIPIPLIVKTGQLKGTVAILYTTDSFLSNDYYLRISKDNGKTWKNYFTGLVANQHYFLKSNSGYPLWKDENHLQIEADITRMTQHHVYGDSPEYAIVKDNALLTFDLSEILKDSDGDGINDIEETRKLFTNPYSKDTDGDGISDAEDNNPKYKTPENDFTKLLQSIMYGNYNITVHQNPFHEEFFIPLATFKEDLKKQRDELPERKKDFVYSLDYRIIVTDDENLKGMEPIDEKIIFLTSKEYSEYSKFNYMNRFKTYYSKVFRCDYKKDTYIFMIEGTTTGLTYLIKRTAEGWKLDIISHWMS